MMGGGGLMRVWREFVALAVARKEGIYEAGRGVEGEEAMFGFDIWFLLARVTT